MHFNLKKIYKNSTFHLPLFIFLSNTRLQRRGVKSTRGDERGNLSLLADKFHFHEKVPWKEAAWVIDHEVPCASSTFPLDPDTKSETGFQFNEIASNPLLIVILRDGTIVW